MWNIYKRIGRKITLDGFGVDSTISKESERGKYLVEWKSDYYMIQSMYKNGDEVTRAGYLVCDDTCPNPLSKSK